MKPASPAFRISPVIAALSLLVLTGWAPAFQTGNYQIRYDSSIRLLGQTNVSDFSCSASYAHGQGEVSVGIPAGEHDIQLTHPTLRIYVPDLDCGNRLMNRDLQSSLKADEYPYIRVKVSTVRLPEVCLSQQTTNFCVTGAAQATIFLAEARKTVWMPIQAECLGRNHFRFSGEIPLQMTHFGVEPPTAMFGMVEVKDQIRVKVDINVTVMGNS